MYVISDAAVEMWTPEALILDFRGLKYEWGDEMVKVFGAGARRWVDDTAFPVLVVVSDLCRSGMTSLVRDELGEDPSRRLFDDIDLAVAFAETTRGRPGA
jgi:hypothetical protein